MNYCFIVLLDYWQLGPLEPDQIPVPRFDTKNWNEVDILTAMDQYFFQFWSIKFLKSVFRL